MRSLVAAILIGFSSQVFSAHASNDAPDSEKFRAERERMVQMQLADRGIRDDAVLRVMRKVPRHEFVPASGQSLAYADGPLPIGWGQTISQPYVVALMTELLDIRKGEKVLEIGTGSGYQAAVLAALGAETFSVEILPDLAAWGRKNLERTGTKNIQLLVGDGHRGWPEHAPFDAIIVTCAPDAIPSPLVEQLKENGRMIIPVGAEGITQELVLVRKKKGQISRQTVIPVRFVPMLRNP